MKTKRKFALKKQLKLLQDVKDYLVNLGMIESPGWFYTHRIQTLVGEMAVSFIPGDVLASVFCRFAEPGRALCQIFGVNEYSGKWNWHWNKWDSDLTYFKTCFAKIAESEGRKP